MHAPFDIAADLDTPVSAFLKLKPFQPHFLLESVEGGQRLARYSFLGFGNAMKVRLDDAGLAVNGQIRSRPTGREELLNCLREILAETPNPTPKIPGIPFTGGLVGVAGYDIVRFFERLPRHQQQLPGLPHAAYVGAESLLIFDHLTRRAALLHDGSETERALLRRNVMDLLKGPVPDSNHRGSFTAPTASMTEEQFMSAVGRAKEDITAGEIYQIVLSVRFAGQSELDPFQAYRALRLLNPSPYMFYCDLGQIKLVGSSPEALVRLQDGQASLRPIAGTRPRGTTPENDQALEAELLGDPKENAEHVMLVDLARNDLGRVAQAGSVHVDPYRTIERYSHVMHIVSGVAGELAPDRDAFDLLAATFPAGTLVGAPKVRAMELIAKYEPNSRGLYAGTVGYFGRDGNMDQAIAIRTLVFNGEEYSFQAGAGIVADSDPAAEYQEVLAKSEILRRALAIAEEGL
jgi:anthranilate synthase component 1